MRVDSTNRGNRSRRVLYVALAVAAIFVLALFLRTYWNVDAAHTGEEFVLSAGSDPYYHKRAIDSIQQNDWQTLIEDPMLNYPYGAINPNPPLFQWSVAVTGQLLSPFFSAQGEPGDANYLTSTEVATWWAMEWSPAIWGALTVIPLYFIGAALFGRGTGIIGAFIYALSPTALEHTSLGAADHDAMVLFFTVLAFAFYVQTIHAFRGTGSWVTNYRDSSNFADGLKRLFRERSTGFAYAALTGVSIAAVALIWKGFPYLLGIIFAYGALQFVVDHWRSRDSLGLFAGTFVALVLGMVLAMPFYTAANLIGFITPAWYIVAAFFVFGLVMVPTRDLPTILVIPVFVVVGAILAAIAFFVVPEVAQSLLYATVYFKQSTLYQTIAEAQPASFNAMVFSVGPVPFLLALIGLGALVVHEFRTPGRGTLFALVWALIGIYMAATAVRFLFNATPILALLGGWMTAWFIKWLDFGAVAKSMRQVGGGWSGARRSIGGMHVIGALALAFLLVIPNMFMAVDAAMPPTQEQEIIEEGDGFTADFISKRFRAFGQNFLDPYWLDGLNWLATQDTDLPPEERPAFMSWWDYGHWAIYQGKHPAVADNFQNGYVPAAHFLLSQNETHSIQLLSARYTNYFESERHESVDGETLTKDTYLNLLEQAGVPANQTEATFKALDSFEHAPALDLESSNELLRLIEETTGKKIRYVAVDYRLMPVDDPRSQNIDYGSIFHAPVILSGQDQEEFVQTLFQTDAGTMTPEQYEDAVSNPYAQPPQAQSQFYAFQPAFFNTMVYKAYVGRAPAGVGAQPVQGDAVLPELVAPQPGYGLQHYRLVYANDNPVSMYQTGLRLGTGVAMLEYYRGATVEGTVLEGDAGREGVTITVYDDAGEILYEFVRERFNDPVGLALAQQSQKGQQLLMNPNFTAEDLNVPHARTISGGNGTYSLIAPPGENITIVASDGNVELGRTSLTVTREQSDAGATVQADPIRIQPGDVTGTVFHDVNGNDTYEADEDELLEGITVEIAGRTATTDANGTYTLTDVSPGQHAVTVQDERYEVSGFSGMIAVHGGEETTHNVSVTLAGVEVTGQVLADDGTALSNVTLPIEPADAANNTAQAPDQPIVSGEDGNYTAELVPGTYVVSGNHTADDGNVYVIDVTFEVPSDTTTVQRDFTYTREGAAEGTDGDGTGTDGTDGNESDGQA